MVDMFLDLQTKPKVASDLVELPLSCLHHPPRLLFYPLLTMSRTTLLELMTEVTRIDELTTTFSCVGAKFSSSGRSMMSSESEWRPPAGAVAWEAYGKILFIKIITT